MPSKTRLELRNLVRTQVQMDDEELPDDLLNTYLNDGLEQTLAIEERWPFLQASWSITTVADQVAYARPSDVENISSVMDVTGGLANVLSYIPYYEAELAFGQGGNATVPHFWSEWADEIHVWDTPLGDRSLIVRGYRQSTWGAADSAVPDVDSRLHVPILWYAVALAYASQEDNEVEQVYMQRWAAAVQRAREQIMAGPTRQPMILSRGAARSGVSRVVWDV